LVAQGNAYYCDCTREDVEARAGVHHVGYDGFCRDRGLEPGPGRALRFRIPETGATTVRDLIRGEPTFENSSLDDFVLVRGNGATTFMLANVADDLDMRVTHVVRGEEHLPNTPKAQLLWQALDDKPPPIWAHVPVLVNAQRQKLSKRRDKVALESYREEGYLAEAMVNYLMTLGWSPPGDREIVPFDDIVRDFRIEDVNPSPAFFDVKKLTAFNGEYLRAMTVDEFTKACEPWLPGEWDRTVFAELAPLVQTRVERLDQVPSMVDFIFTPEAPVESEATWRKVMDAPNALAIVDGAIAAYESCRWEADVLKAELEKIGAAYDLKLGKAQAPVRVAVTGRTVGPPLFESLVVLGRERTLERLRAARARG
jgi:glutamyl-tRNA synthetase